MHAYVCKFKCEHNKIISLFSENDPSSTLKDWVQAEEPAGGSGGENMGWAFDGAVCGVFMTRQRQARNELTDQSFLLARRINSSVLTVYIKL